MTSERIARLGCLVLLATSAGCATTGPNGVPLRSDGSPLSEKCPEETVKMMRYLRVRVGDSAWVELDANQDDVTPITLYDGPIESVLDGELGTLESPTRLYGWVWTGGPQVVIRYYAAQPMDGEKIAICAVARKSKGQLRKRPESKPGTAVLDYSSASVYIVDEFR